MKVCLIVCLALAHLAAANIFKRHHQTRQEALNLPLTYIDPASYNQLLDQQFKYQKDLTRSKEDRSQERKYASSQERSQEKKHASSQARSQEMKYASSQERTQEKKYASSQERSQEKKYSSSQERSQEKKYSSSQERSQEKKYANSQERSQEKKYASSQERSQEKNQYPSNDYRNPETAEISSHEADEQIRVNILEYQQSPMEQRIWSPRSALPISSYLVQEQPKSEMKRYPFQQKDEQIKYYQAPRKSEQQYPTKRSSENMKQYKTAYGDSVAWNGIRMAVGPRSPIADEKDIARIFEDAYKTVKDFSVEEKKTFHDMYMTAAENEDTHLNATQLLQKYQYPVEEHTVKTEDGYILTLFRIPPKQKTRDVQKRPVVFLMHGLLGSADDWLLSGPGVSLAYLLADADYDVWMGNARGNKYSRRHVSKHPAQPDFWQFSNDEIALLDLPAMIDFALNTTHQEKMYYVGFSEGTTTFFALTSSRPEYNDKIIMMYALSPMVYMSHTRSPLLKMIAPNSPFYERLHQILGHGEFKPTNEMIQTVGGDMLARKFGCKHVASNVNLVMSGMVDNYDPKIVPMIASHLPAGASTRQMKQYGQAVATTFRRYDYGSVINMKVYGSEQPIKYEMSKVRVPVTLYYSSEDWLAQPMDVEQLRSELSHVEAHQVPQFSHLDFQFSKAAPEAVYQRLIASMEKNQSQQ